jgi:hypothetical protein
MAKHIHEQSTSSNIWNIPHNLGQKPIFDVLIYKSGQLTKALPKIIQHVNDNNLQITFTSNETGVVTCIASNNSNSFTKSTA